MSADELSFWATHSGVTDPGAQSGALEALGADIEALVDVTCQLVFHYRGDGDWAANGIGVERGGEIDLCYASEMLGRLLELAPDLTRDRAAPQRILGCCRDFTTLYLTALRQRGVPARARVGFADYFETGWWIDHVVAEVWDPASQRWRRIDPELRSGFRPADGGPFDRLDLGPRRFLSAAQAWLAARAGEIDPARVVVSPGLEIPQTRGFFQLAHNLVHDLAALNKIELLLWQDWGLSLLEDPLAPEVSDVLDALASDIAAADVTLASVRRWSEHPLLAVPATVLQFSPLDGSARWVDVGRALAASPRA